MSGYIPSARFFCLPPKRYANRQYLPPLECTNKKSPPPSDNLYGLTVGFAFFTCKSVSAMISSLFCYTNNRLSYANRYANKTAGFNESA
jgi:hypothetical protein